MSHAAAALAILVLTFAPVAGLRAEALERAQEAARNQERDEERIEKAEADALTSMTGVLRWGRALRRHPDDVKVADAKLPGAAAQAVSPDGSADGPLARLQRGAAEYVAIDPYRHCMLAATRVLQVSAFLLVLALLCVAKQRTFGISGKESQSEN